MYPLMEETMKSLSEQICKSQSLDEVSYTTDNQYTATVLLNAVEEALEKAEMGTTETEE